MDCVIGCTTRPYNKLSFAAAFERIAAAGYGHVAVFASEGQVPVRSDSGPAEVAAVREAAAQAGVVPSMLIGRTRLDLGLADAVADYKKLIDNAVALRATWLLDCGIGKEELFDDYFELMRQVAPHAEACGLNLTMKPHGGISLTAEDLMAAYRKVDHPAFAICYDPGNIIYYTKGERRPGDDVIDVAPMVSTAIIKDCTVEDDTANVQVTAGDGLVDFPLVLRNLAKGGFGGPVYVECVGSTETADVDRDVAFTLGYVTGILSAVA